ncbi:MAG: hypothetical protein KIT72_02645 [Polyangiaceae bacterium]|nr:hypothetical protein [Polyangiaceae bacterium]MCW5789298.1 hypothetical protein [Polyangiaceae bacterium]
MSLTTGARAIRCSTCPFTARTERAAGTPPGDFP